MTGMMQLLAMLSGTLSYQLPPGKSPAEPATRFVAEPISKGARESSRQWLRPLFPDDSDRQCSSLFARQVPGFGSVRADFGCVKSKRETTPWQ